ncbi:MAG TPA: DUF4442 domain-containing protein [Mycobacteriales bacterium]|nr:DUF4442 domain-containing protein [Mycobacteriales bacterium]
MSNPGEMLLSLVPFARTLGVSFDEVSAGRAVARLPDRTDLHNHVGGPHAGVLFSLGETASGAVILAAYADLIERALPVAAGGEIRYRAIAQGEVTAEAVPQRGRAEVLAELDAAAAGTGKPPRIPVAVTIRDLAGNTTAEMSVTWALRPNGAAAPAELSVRTARTRPRR